MTTAPQVKRELARHLGGKTGRKFWRSLEELSGTPAFRAFVESEFPALGSNKLSLDRRSMLKIMAASLAFAGLSACRGEEDEAAYPYVAAPDNLTVGQAKWYATAVNFAGFAQPVLGKTFAGRPVKLEGNPDHPTSRGATDAFTQAALLGLYDPARSQMPRRDGKPADWNAFDVMMARRAGELDTSRGKGFRIVTGPFASPTLLRQISLLTQRWPEARWHMCETVPEDFQRAATARVFGRPLDLHLHLDRAEIILCLDDDFLGPGPRQTPNAGAFAERRRMRQAGTGECRLFVAEPLPTATGAVADERLAISPFEIDGLLRAMAAGLGLPGIETAPVSKLQRKWIDHVVGALKLSQGKALILVGSMYAPETQQLALLINEALGSFGTALTFREPILARPRDGDDPLKHLVEDMQAGRVSTLAVIDANPAYNGAGDLDFADAMKKVELSVHAGLYVDETAELSHWHVPLQHDLESWSDGRAIDGSVCIVQPLVRPFFDVRSVHVVLENLQGRQGHDRDLVQQTWMAAWGSAFDLRWRESLVKGMVDGSAAADVAAQVTDRSLPSPPPVPDHSFALCIRPDAGIWDGVLSSNAWAQETPRPLSKITWGNVIQISPKLASEQGLENGDEVRISAGAATVIGAAWIMPGQEYRTIGITLGYGRRAQDSIAVGLGYDAYALRQFEQPWHLVCASIEKTGNRLTVATTQTHQSIDGYDFIRTVSLSDLAEHVEDKEKQAPPSFYPKRQQQDPSWGMSIDLDLCIGCNACVTACQAENNIPVVGRELVAEGREMHWLRIDHYYEGEVDNPRSYFQPVPCMHCEQAPCEMGCPVNAAVHSIDGLNLQVYNRCIGTRTCSSYCPYKVRRFNWFDYTQDDPEPIKAMRNPDVTVRSRGVMEKCTYCVQRIAEARIVADKDGRPIRDGEIVTACQQACPTQAIVFGNVADPGSRVSRRKAEERDYALLEEVNTRPRTTYLARIEDKRGRGKGVAG